jgi:glycosyltransferase involved in cell wall biosynthesis
MFDQSVKKIRRVIIADPTLQDWSGHHAPYDFSVADGLKMAGCEVEILANRDCSFIGTELSAKYNILNVFTWNDWGRRIGSPRIYLRYKFLILLAKVLLLLQKLSKFGFTFENSELSHFHAWLKACSNLKEYYEVLTLLMKRKFGSGDILFVHTVTEHNLHTWALVADYISTCKNGGEIVILYRFFEYRIDPNSCHQRLSLKLFERAFQRGHFRACSDSAVLVEKFSSIFAVPMSVYPIPHIPKFRITKTSRQGGAIRCTSLGGARYDKGILDIFQAIKLLNETGRGNQFKFQLQVNNASTEQEWGFPRTLSEIVQEFMVASPFNVEFYTEPLSAESYQRLIEESDVILSPYWDNEYYSRTSGTVLEALAAGKIVISTEGTWMARELRRFSAGCEIISSRDPAALAAALCRISDDIEIYKKKALAAVAGCREFHNPDVFAHNLLCEASP